MGPTPNILRVMIEGLSSPMYTVRCTSLSGLYELRSHLSVEGPVGLQLVAWILISCHDSNKDLAKMANKWAVVCDLHTHDHASCLKLL